MENICEWKNCREIGKFKEAIVSYKQALTINPKYTLSNYNEALIRLTLEEFDIGWKKYEYRWLVKDNFARRHQNIPLWVGDKSISGKKILVWSEQGLGDCIQFCRYILNLLEMNAQVIIEVSPSLKKLVETISQKVQVVNLCLPGAMSVSGQARLHLILSVVFLSGTCLQM